MNNIDLRDYMATQVLQGIVSADWKFDIKDKTWDEQAVKRAYELADKMLAEREITNVQH
jgi:hypothetical protein